ncbi:MAG: hypothetical protein OK454_00195 [Thaumarchaeota archaeon]|nr:hypothetical protein [Nitrososphaerota archaeon]
MRGGPSGFTVLIRDGQAFFGQQVFHRPVTPIRPRGYLVLNLFERFGEDGIANKVWRRLGFPPLPSLDHTHGVHAVDPVMPVVVVEPVLPVEVEEEPEEKLRLIRYIRPMSAMGECPPYQEEYMGLLVVEEGPCEDDTGTLEIISQITLRYTHVIRRSI